MGKRTQEKRVDAISRSDRTDDQRTVKNKGRDIEARKRRIREATADAGRKDARIIHSEPKEGIGAENQRAKTLDETDGWGLPSTERGS